MAPATHLDATPPLTSSNTPSSSTATTEPATPASPICTKAHAVYCFDVLVAHFEGREPMSPPFENPDEPLCVAGRHLDRSERGADGLQCSLCHFEHDESLATQQEAGIEGVHWELYADAPCEGSEGVRVDQVCFHRIERLWARVSGQAPSLIYSALEDHRFSPITKSELPSLQCRYVFVLGDQP